MLAYNYLAFSGQIMVFGGNDRIRTYTLLRMKEVHDHYATLPNY